MTPRALTLCGILAIAACAKGDEKLQIRATSPLASQADKPVPERIAEARAQFALGNIGLALELFRKASRELPSSVDALAGLAACYDKMGRFDLSRSYFERALALAPREPVLLRSFAASLELQGLSGEAAAVRSEAEASTIEIGTQSITITLPPARPADGSGSSVSPVAARGPLGNSMTISLPEVASAVAPVRSPSGEGVDRAKVRLERINAGEVALVTSGRSPWKNVTATKVDVRRPSPSGEVVRLLNAAGHRGLAARARVSLKKQGWGQILIGDAAHSRRTSLVLYSVENRSTATRLAKRFGLGLAREPRPGRVTVLLGRDSIDLFRGKGA